MNLCKQIDCVRQRIARYCHEAGRDPSEITLIAVTKSQDPAVLPMLRELGIRDFGENRVEHLQAMLAKTETGDRWHYIGRIQSRQLPKIAPYIACLHSLCDLSHAQRLYRLCCELQRRLPVFVQVNASGETTKAGIALRDVSVFLEQLRAYPTLEPVGLMTMAPELGVQADERTVRTCFSATRQAAAAAGLRYLSMGMSGDYHLAILEGATHLRLGSCLFSVSSKP